METKFARFVEKLNNTPYADSGELVDTSDGEIDTSRDLKQPFAKGSSARGNHGTGLGLAIANNNLAMLGYKLEIRISEDRFIAEVKL